MNNPLVSVIIVVKDGEKYLAEAIETVIKQTYQNHEIIVVDGNSVDNTAKIAQSYSQVRYLLQKSQGIARAYNQGIEAAKGDIIAFLSHDDLWTPHKLITQVNYLLNHSEIQYTVAKVKFFLEAGHTPPPGFREELLEGEHTGKIMETLVARKSLFAEVGKLDPEFNVAEDVDWFARCNDAGIPAAVMPEVLLYKRVHDTNLSLNAANNNQNLLKVLRQSIKRKRQQEEKK
ncbi:MAG: glycosyltransferase [Spirulinaceae cyanobacterium]